MKVDKVKEKELYSKVVLLQASNLSLTKQKKESVLTTICNLATLLARDDEVVAVRI
jgi:hypothetical protein